MSAPTATRGTLAHFFTRRWADINLRCVNGKGARPDKRKLASYFRDGVRIEFTRDQFKIWCSEQWPQIKSLYEAGEVPSVDRIKVTEHYTLDNIRIIPWGQNSRLARKPQRKLTADEVTEVRRMLSEGMRQVDIAAKFGVSQVSISHLKRGMTYAQ